MIEKSYRKKNKKYERMKREKTKSLRKGKKQSKPE
jgi:hypothetical protein